MGLGFLAVHLPPTCPSADEADALSECPGDIAHSLSGIPHALRGRLSNFRKWGEGYNIRQDLGDLVVVLATFTWSLDLLLFVGLMIQDGWNCRCFDVLMCSVQLVANAFGNWQQRAGCP